MTPPSWIPGRRHLAALGLGLVASLGVTEGALRLVYPTLPSLAAAWGYEGRWTAAGASPEHAGNLPLSPPRRFHHEGAGAPVRVVFAGDSTTATLDVPIEAAWWAHVAAGLGGGSPIDVTNSASPGANAEQLAAEVARAGPADFMLFTLFADDLEDYQAFSVDARPVLLPAAAAPWLRPLVTHSFLANDVWFHTVTERGLGRGRRLDDEGLVRFDRAIAAALAAARSAGARAGFVLMPAPNLADCPAASPADHPCTTFPADLAEMAQRLDAVGAQVLDLRPLFARTTFPLTAKDQAGIRAGRLRVGLHVGEAGQARIGEAVVDGLRSLGWPVAPVAEGPWIADPGNPAPDLATTAVPTHELRVAGPEASRSLNGALSAALEAQGFAIAPVLARGDTAVSTLRSGSADVALTSHPPADSDLSVTTFGYSGLALWVADRNPIRAVTDAQAEALVRGEIPTWAALGGEATPVSRSALPGVQPERFVDGTRAARTVASVEEAIRDPGALVIAALEAGVPSRGAHVLVVDGHEPRGGGLAGYSLARPLLAVTLSPPPPGAARFVQLLTAPEGRLALVGLGVPP